MNNQGNVMQENQGLKPSPDAEDLKVLSIMGEIWSTPSPAIEPEIRLLRWSVFELPSGARHLVGYNASHREGRVSTAIIVWNFERQRGTTSSGRKYQLVGEAGHGPDGLYVWEHFSQGSASFDVTQEYVRVLISDEEGNLS